MKRKEGNARLILVLAVFLPACLAAMGTKKFIAEDKARAAELKQPFIQRLENGKVQLIGRDGKPKKNLQDWQPDRIIRKKSPHLTEEADLVERERYYAQPGQKHFLKVTHLILPVDEELTLESTLELYDLDLNLKWKITRAVIGNQHFKISSNEKFVGLASSLPRNDYARAYPNQIEVFDLNGNLIFKEDFGGPEKLGSGFMVMDIGFAENDNALVYHTAAKCYVVNLTTKKKTVKARYTQNDTEFGSGTISAWEGKIQFRWTTYENHTRKIIEDWEEELDANGAVKSIRRIKARGSK